MAQPSQRRAVASYRRRQDERGLCRYEVRGLDPDKALVRRSAARLVVNDQEAQRLRAELMRDVLGEPGVGSLKVVTLSNGALPDRHEHPRRGDEASIATGGVDVVERAR